MSIHKLTAGSGYDYLTRQVAAQDVTEKGHTGLASYYAARGESPGRWVGSGLAGVDGLAAGDVVTAEQMQALFGSGHHPLAQQRSEQLQGPDLTANDYQAVTRLGVPYKVYAHDVSAFRLEVAQRIANLNASEGQPAGSAGSLAVPMGQQARIRTQVAVEFFRAEHGRDPADAREVAATIAKHSRPRTTAVAGYDLTFSPVKSVSTLWAVADPVTAARIERAHQAAVTDALRFLEEHALYTRTGTNGVRQVNVQGLVATAFTHRDSRAGDPDLHTHVAVANKVQTGDGRWLSIDGRVLYKANVAASETYNTALEKHLGADLGLRFQERPGPDARKRPIREVVGVDERLNARWSARRASIQARRGELAAQFQAAHGRPPTEVESIQLAQQATLETRDAKKEPRSLTEQRQTWRAQAAEVLGTDRAVTAMVRSAVAADRGATVPAAQRVDASWVQDTAATILATIESRRGTWQVWHVRAEALRQVRPAQLAPRDVEPVVDVLVGEVLDRRSVRLTPAGDGITEPARLRRRDDASVYTVHGAEQYTSATVLAAEARIVAAAGRTDGRTVPAEAVDLALLETTANGVTLNAGQVALVRGMATSGARLQLAIAPAGAGKTTAMRALAAAWENGGGTLIGLAPSAAAAAALHAQIDNSAHTDMGRSVQTDTLAKLTWSLQHPHLTDLPPWAQGIGPDTLVVIDEAGMADTLSLDTAVAFITSRGASVRLIGDDQQLAAIGAGGVLRDIDATHPALRLTELIRFADPAEGAASLALREGQPEALGFYLDQGRVHVGDAATMTEDVFGAWQADRARGLDAIMLAPTRELASELNQRARAHRLTGTTPANTGAAAASVRLADGNHASAGDLIITRSNDRRLRVGGCDWVKNGDRWTVLAVNQQDGTGAGLTVQHTRTRRIIQLPADYVAGSTELGYATTVHAAQGVSVDAVHGLATGAESRQQLYTMLTRGRRSNDVYLQVVSDGDPHNAIRPEAIAPPTPTDLLRRILAKDDSPVSATTMRRELDDPATLLGQAAARYTDALYVAAEDLLGHQAVATLEASAEVLVPGLSDDAAWPTLRAHLLLLSAHGADPGAALARAVEGRELDTAVDRAAVLDWRLDDTGLRNAGRGPLPWLPGVPQALAQHPTWAEYLHRRHALVQDLTGRVRSAAADSEAPSWARQGTARHAPELLGEVAVWRAAMQVPPQDRRPTGPPQMQKAAARWQARLTRAVAGDRSPALQEWGDLLLRMVPSARHDDFTPLLAERLAALSRAGLPARRILNAALGQGSLPDDHAAAAVWWRLSRHLAPAVATEVDHGHALTSGWVSTLVDRVGQDRVEQMRASSWWPPLVASIDHALHRGWALEDVLGTASTEDAADRDLDPCQAMVWRLSVLTDPPPPAEDLEEAPHPDQTGLPADFWDQWAVPGELVDAPDPQQWQDWAAVDQSSVPDRRRAAAKQGTTAAATTGHEDLLDDHVEDPIDVDLQLQLAALARALMGPLEPSDATIEAQVARAADLDFAPVPAARMLEVNRMALAFFQTRYAHSWAQRYLTDRLGRDPAEHPHLSPGYAPGGWTALVAHLRRLGVTDEEMTETGVATRARTGRLIDRFRDRAMMPIEHDGQVLGFVGRRHPELTEQDHAGPKYLNTADTPLFHKGAQLFGLIPAVLARGATPVLVEGPLDAWAVTLAASGSHVGVAPLGTALTGEQADQLARLGRAPVVATDADTAGRVAAERDFWLLAQHGVDPAAACFPEGCDPAGVLATRGPVALLEALSSARPLGDLVLGERLANLSGQTGLTQAVQVAAARPAQSWEAAATAITARLDVPPRDCRERLLHAVVAWNRNPREAAADGLASVRQVRDRMAAADQRHPDKRWVEVAHGLDPRLPSQGDWPALAAIMSLAHRDGHDVAATAGQLIAAEPLGRQPAQDLRYRLIAALPLDLGPAPTPIAGGVAPRSGAERDRRAVHPRRERSPGPRR